MEQDDKCYCCGKGFRNKQNRYLARTDDGAQTVYVGPDCHEKIVKAGAKGYQPMKRGKPWGCRMFDLQYIEPAPNSPMPPESDG